jgi:hypothetical protein
MCILSGPIPRPVALLPLLAAARADSQCSFFLRTYQMQPPDWKGRRIDFSFQLENVLRALTLTKALSLSCQSSARVCPHRGVDALLWAGFRFFCFSSLSPLCGLSSCLALCPDPLQTQQGLPANQDNDEHQGREATLALGRLTDTRKDLQLGRNWGCLAHLSRPKNWSDPC